MNPNELTNHWDACSHDYLTFGGESSSLASNNTNHALLAPIYDPLNPIAPGLAASPTTYLYQPPLGYQIVQLDANSSSNAIAATSLSQVNLPSTQSQTTNKFEPQVSTTDVLTACTNYLSSVQAKKPGMQVYQRPRAIVHPPGTGFFSTLPSSSVNPTLTQTQTQRASSTVTASQTSTPGFNLLDFTNLPARQAIGGNLARTSRENDLQKRIMQNHERLLAQCQANCQSGNPNVKPVTTCVMTNNQNNEMLLQTIEKLEKTLFDFQTNALTLISDLAVQVKNLSKTVNELPDKLKAMNVSRSVSIISEREIEEMMENVDMNDEEEEDDETRQEVEKEDVISVASRDDAGHVNKKFAQANVSEDETQETKTSKFIFHYDPTIDLDKWIKKDDKK